MGQLETAVLAIHVDVHVCMQPRGRGLKRSIPTLKITSVNAYHLKPEREKKKVQ